MSFNKQKEFVEEQDTIVLYLGRQSLSSITVDSNLTHQTKFGAFPHKDFIGERFGTKVYSKNRKGWVYLLHPSPELWTVTLPHRTQILYSTDISLITMQLELTPGSVVIESGTGSGSLSHAIIRSIKPTGHLYTFDFHEKRAEKACEEFKQHGLHEYVTCKCADACKDGFSIDHKADAVFLDLPAPWDAITHAKTALKLSGGRICSFSPCIEQVQRTCDMLRQLRFCEIQTVECLLRSLDVKTIPVQLANLGEDQPIHNSNGKKTKLEIECSDDNNKDIYSETLPHQENTGNDDPIDGNILQNDVDGLNSKGLVTRFTVKPKEGYCNVLTSKGRREEPGHTGYLTFASLYSV